MHFWATPNLAVFAGDRLVALVGVIGVGVAMTALRGNRYQAADESPFIGHMAEVRRPVGAYQEGFVFVAGELWKARLVGANVLVAEGSWVQVVGQQGLLLLVAIPTDGYARPQQ